MYIHIRRNIRTRKNKDKILRLMYIQIRLAVNVDKRL